MTTCALLVLVCLSPSMLDDDRPMALVALENSRAALRTGRVIWSTRCNRPRKHEGIIFKWYSHDVPRYFTSRFTPEEWMVEDNGDPSGVVFPTESGAPHPDLGYLPMRYLYYDNARWERREHGLGAEVFQGRMYMPEPRTLGFSTDVAVSMGCHRLLWGSGQEFTFETREVDGLYEVTRLEGNSDFKVTYLIDPQRGWNPVRMTVFGRGRQLYDVRSTLKKYGDVWFPHKVEIYEYSHKDGREPAYVVDVLSASFNQPDDPKRLTPESIGIEVGTNIRVLAKEDTRSIGTFGWDGEKLVPLDELFKRVKAGELELGPGFKAEVERGLALGRKAEQVESEWERYVKRFIKKYRLNEEQSEKAFKILRDCQRRARDYLSRYEEQIEKVRQSVRELTDPSERKAVNQAEQIAKLKERMLQLQGPVWDIYYREFLPRLEKLPTRAQRKAVAEREQSGNKKKKKKQ